MKKVKFLGEEYEVSDYIKFIARDSDGGVWGFDKRPEININGDWYSRNGTNEFLATTSVSTVCMEIK